MRRPERDAHHLLHDRVSWEARPDGKILRSKLIAKGMARSAHVLLHRENSAVPVPLYPTLNWVSFRFDESGDIFKDVDHFSSLLEAANRRRPHPIEQEINLLCIDALQGQIPRLQDGLDTATIIDLGDYR